MSEQWGSPDPSARRDPPPPSDVQPATGASSTPARPEDVERAQAVKELKRRRDFAGAVGGWVGVSALTTVIWFATGAPGYFWPIWPMIGVGIGVAGRAASIWSPAKKDITEAEIAAQMRRREQRGR
ncbi:2TM domain-containing protein [Rathayibacter oskolensis]|uniref:2TM domain-containing protein n=1 Tax=Rathayibacter oskolensis TaxID=1891671 RepID=A0A1X7P7T2_9MICO|nr:2TM domain-containing protein [Rathayibacter oskolensis]SMH46359.1 2TM domain-containing protein [Rathayibacter oskolensis]